MNEITKANKNWKKNWEINKPITPNLFIKNMLANKDRNPIIAVDINVKYVRDLYAK